MQSRIFWLLIFAGVLIIGAIIGVALTQDVSIPATGGDIHKFESTEALKAYLKEHQGTSVTGYYILMAGLWSDRGSVNYGGRFKGIPCSAGSGRQRHIHAIRFSGRLLGHQYPGDRGG